MAADVLLNIKGLEERCSLSATEKPLWGAPAQGPLELQRRNDEDEREDRAVRESTIISFVVHLLSWSFRYSPDKLNTHQATLQSQV